MDRIIELSNLMTYALLKVSRSENEIQHPNPYVCDLIDDLHVAYDVWGRLRNEILKCTNQ